MFFIPKRGRVGWRRQGKGCGLRAYKNRISMNDNHIQFNLIFQRRKAKSEVEGGWLDGDGADMNAEKYTKMGEVGK
jgi:hypothetical protein